MPSRHTLTTGPVSALRPRAFVSYSHDSLQHKARVLALVQQLRDDGVDCEVDSFEEAPREGWPAWMERHISESDFVLVVCTATYNRRVSGRELHGVGLGARWEGNLITQAIYEAGGRNDKFIPVVFTAADVKEIPEFLKGTTRYDPSTGEGYTKLLRRLTRQLSVIRRPLGSIKPLPPEKPVTPQPTRNADPPPKQQRRTRQTTKPSSPADTDLVLIEVGAGTPHFIHAVSIEASQSVSLVLAPTTGPDRVMLEELAKRGSQSVSIAYGLTALRGRVTALTHTRTEGADRFNLVLAPEPDPGSSMEMGTTGYSADDIAVLRARRILLDEAINTRAGGLEGPRAEDSMLDTLIRGLNGPRPVERSPLPPLRRQLQGTPRAQFPAAARLTAVLWLRLTGTVEHILELDIRLKGTSTLSVRFHGRRRREYSNREPVDIRVEGHCAL